MESMHKKASLEILRISRSSWFRISIGELVIHLDPGFAGNQGIDLFAYKQDADYIFITHPHKDHFRNEVIDIIKKTSTEIFGPQAVQNEYDGKVTLVKPNDVLKRSKFNIQVVDAYNTESGHSTRKYHLKGDFVGYLINIGDRVIYFAGDTDLIPEMSNFGKIDIAMIPIGGTYVMDMGEAISCIKILNPDIVIPMHQADTPLEEFEKALAQEWKGDIVLLSNQETANL
jgi:L-ascorbate metabolism protein UlaG (beta-lactamase superfamily)